MKNKNLFKKIILIAFAVALVLSMILPAVFSQSTQTPKQEKLLNGLKVLMWSDAKADKVAVRLRIHAGSAFDPQGKEGVMQMLADNIFPEETARAFFTEDLGGDIEIITNYDYIQINASSKPEGFLTMMETISAAVANPGIDKETTQKLRNALLRRVAELEAHPAYISDQAVSHRLFGTFPYGRPQKGSLESVKKIDFPDLIDARERFLTADNATIAVTGNFDRALAFRAIRRYFGGWLKSDKKVPLTFRQPDEPASEVLMVEVPKPIAAISRFAIRGVARNDKDLAPSLVFAAILEQRLRSRLPGQAAGDLFVRSDPHTLPGIIMIGFNSPIPGPDAKTSPREMVTKALADLVTEEEFRTASAAVRNTWAKQDPVSFWLDADTYKTFSPEADARLFDKISLADVNAYAARARKLPFAVVMISSAAPKGN